MIGVIGAGISGLAAAHELVRRGETVRVFEANPEPGGSVGTVERSGFLFERGPNSVPESSEPILEFAKELGLENEIIRSRKAAERRLLYVKGRLEEVPTGPKPLLKSRIFSGKEKARMLMEPFVPKRRSEGPESIANFVARRFGRAPARTLVDAFVSGIYAGDARHIGVGAAFPRLVAMEKESGSILRGMKKKARAAKKAGKPTGIPGLINFRRGFGQLIEAAASSLGDQLQLGSRVTRVSRREGGGFVLAVQDTTTSAMEECEVDQLVIAVPTRAVGKLVSQLSPLLSDILFDVQYAPLLAIHAGISCEELPDLPEAFGFLIPRPQRLRSLGWLFTSMAFEGRAPEGHHAITGYLGGASDEAIVDSPDEAVTHLALGELSMVLRMAQIPRPTYLSVERYQPGIPQYDLGHLRRTKAIRALLAEVPDLTLVGNYLGGVSLGDCVKNARQAASELVGRESQGAAS